MEYFWLGLVYAYSKCHVCSGANKAKFLFFYFFRQLTFVSGIVSWISWFRIWSQSNEVTKNQSMHGLGTAHRNWSKYFFIVKFRHFFSVQASIIQTFYILSFLQLCIILNIRCYQKRSNVKFNIELCLKNS